MPDARDMLAAAGAAALLAAVIAAVLAAPWRPPRAAPAAVGLALGVALGIHAGWWWSGQPLEWPPASGRDRLLALIVPAAAFVEVIAHLPRLRAWVRWLLRAVLAGALLPVILRNSSYLGATATVDAWSPAAKWSWLLLFPVALLVAWALLERLAARQAGRSVPLLVGLAGGAAGVTIMLSGSVTTGQLGPPIAGALFGAAVGAMAMSPPRGIPSAAGVGFVALAGLLVVGRFFADLRPLHLWLLMLAPLLGWLTELPRVRKDRAWRVTAIRLVLVLIPLGLVALQAQRQFDRDFPDQSAGSSGGGADDYMSSGQ